MTDEQVDNAIEALVNSALSDLYRGMDDDLPCMVLSRLEDAIIDWDGWEDFVIERDYEQFLDCVDDVNMNNYYEERCK